MNIVKVARVLFLRVIWLAYFNIKVKVVDQIQVLCRKSRGEIFVEVPDRRLEKQLADAYFTADLNLAKTSK